MHIFFDMDYTIIETDEGTMRPGVREVFDRLTADGHEVYVWSAMGIRTEEVRLLGLHEVVRGVYQKPWEHYRRDVQAMVARGEIPVMPDLVVDDTAAVVRALGGVVIAQYGAKSPPGDREMERVYTVISECATHGHSTDTSFFQRSEI